MQNGNGRNCCKDKSEIYKHCDLVKGGDRTQYWRLRASGKLKYLSCENCYKFRIVSLEMERYKSEIYLRNDEVWRHSPNVIAQSRVGKGISAQASHRTVREALTSYGSCHTNLYTWSNKVQ